MPAGRWPVLLYSGLEFARLVSSYASLRARCGMCPDAKSRQPERDDQTTGGSPGRDDDPASSGVLPVRTMDLCGWGMLLVGSGMPFAVDEEWWVWLPIAGMVILMLLMAMVQERWLMRERHRLIVSALKRTGVPNRSGRSRSKASRVSRTRPDGKPVETAARSAEGDPVKLRDGAGPPPDSPHAPVSEVVGAEAAPEEKGSKEEPPGNVEEADGL